MGFGGKPKPQQPRQPQAPAPGPKKPVKKINLGEQQERMSAKEKVLAEKITDIERQMAPLYKKMKGQRGMSQKRTKQRLVMLLKKKKMYSQQLNQMMNNNMTLDNL